MDSVFRELRADFDVSSLVYAKNKIEELNKVNVDSIGEVSTLATLSVASNGVITGLRGTGKSHFLLLARNEINLKKTSFCVYINLKEHFNIGGTPILDERFYVWVILTQIKTQLKLLSDNGQSSKKQNIIKMIADFFNKKDSNTEEELAEVFKDIETLISFGEKEISELSIDKSNESKQEYGSNYEVSSKLTLNSLEASGKITDSEKETFGENTKYQSKIMLNTNALKSLLVKIVEILGLKSIIFFYDEWSSRNKSEQEKLSKLIQALSTSPLHHWIAYIPYKSSLGVLELTADMPHVKELDLKYIYEENNQICREYFLEFANKRLEAVFKESTFQIQDVISISSIDMLVKACMGNTRDFGILLYKAWSNYKNDILAKEKCRIINKRHIVQAIKSLSREKLDNLRSSENHYSEKLWNEIIKFVGQKKHTHFCIELNKENQTFINQDEFQNLLYHRLIHLRKNDIPPKDGGEYRLAMYAVDISTIHSRIYETKSESKQIKAVTDINVIHNQVRRYIFDLASIINGFRVEQGKQIICKSCGKALTSDMKLAWELKKCIFCGEPF
jgi:hypothetical protein